MSTPTSSVAPLELESVVQRLLNEAKEEDQTERRGEERRPFFRPATLTHRYGVGDPIDAFTREISVSGIGLLHRQPLDRGEVAVAVQSDRAVPFRTYILWCRPCGHGWYISGGQFLGLVEPDG